MMEAALSRESRKNLQKLIDSEKLLLPLQTNFADRYCP